MVKRTQSVKRRLKKSGTNNGERDAIVQPRVKVSYSTDGSDNDELLGFLKSLKGPEERFNRWLYSGEQFARKTLEKHGYVPDAFFSEDLSRLREEERLNGGCIEHRLRKKHGDMSEPSIALDALQLIRLLKKQLENSNNFYMLIMFALDIHSLLDKLAFIELYEQDAAIGRDQRLSGHGPKKYSQEQKDGWVQKAKELIESEQEPYVKANGSANIRHIALQIQTDMNIHKDMPKPFETIRRYLSLQLKKR